jgi:hypothetical protein
MKKCPRSPMKLPEPEKAKVKPTTMNTMPPITMVNTFLVIILIVFFDLVNPASIVVNPRCIINTRKLAINTHIVSNRLISIDILITL